MMTRTNIYLPKQELATARVLAEQERITTSELVRRALRKEITGRDTGWAASLLKLAQGAKKGGPRDLAKNHDYYLAQIVEEKLIRGRKEVKKLIKMRK